jgi:hypothetical protein
MDDPFAELWRAHEATEHDAGGQCAEGCPYCPELAPRAATDRGEKMQARPERPSARMKVPMKRLAKAGQGDQS